jgi:NTP pyrophosphatase (non-canonical NTP hydrolase)
MIDAFNLDDAILRVATKVFGYKNQSEKAVEECAELIVAIKHFNSGKVSKEDLASEIADVYIMCQQLAMYVGPAMVDQQVSTKCIRLRERIEETRFTHDQAELSRAHSQKPTPGQS